MYVNMSLLTQCIEADTTWADLGLPQLYGTVAVGTTDPTHSNSGNMFAGLLANTLCGGVADASNIEEILPRLQSIFQKLGYMESSSDLFDQFLKTGMGAKPLIAGYESQLLEFAVQNPETWEQVKDDILIMYPPRSGPPTCLLRWMRQGPPGSMPCWMRRYSGWPGRSTASAPACMTRRPPLNNSACRGWRRDHPGGAYAGRGHHGADYCGAGVAGLPLKAEEYIFRRGRQNRTRRTA